jgi:GNAT superfamily N-acetyltransferase
MNRAAADRDAHARALIERVLRDGREIASEYPLVFREGASGKLLTSSDGDAVRAACAVLVRDFVAGPHTVRVGLIGSVATDPAYRGRGHATLLLAAAEERLAREGCTFAMLWADDPRFYAARGYRPIGCEIDFALDAEQCATFGAPGGIRAAAADDSPTLHRLYTTHRERVDRSRDETRALLAGPDIETLVLQRGREIVAYSCLGRGRDFARTIHEWAGCDDDVLALAREHSQRDRARSGTGAIYLIAPATATALHRRLRASGATEARGVLAQGKLLDVHGAAALLGAHARTSVDDGGHGIAEVRIHGPRAVATLDAVHLLDLLVPARGIRTRIDALELATGLSLPELPLPIFAWGLDSI